MDASNASGVQKRKKKCKFCASCVNCNPQLAKRQRASLRERIRVKNIKEGFTSLQKILPDVSDASDESSLTHLSTLVAAVEYVRILKETLQRDDYFRNQLRVLQSTDLCQLPYVLMQTRLAEEQIRLNAKVSKLIDGYKRRLPRGAKTQKS